MKNKILNTELLLIIISVVIICIFIFIYSNLFRKKKIENFSFVWTNYVLTDPKDLAGWKIYVEGNWLPVNRITNQSFEWGGGRTLYMGSSSGHTYIWTDQGNSYIRFWGGPDSVDVINLYDLQPQPPGTYRIKRDCALSDWINQGNCSKPCAGGEVTQLKNVVAEPQMGGTACPDSNSPERKRIMPCNTHNCLVRKNPIKTNEIKKRLEDAKDRADTYYAEMMNENELNVNNFLQHKTNFEKAEKEVSDLISRCRCDCS